MNDNVNNPKTSESVEHAEVDESSPKETFSKKPWQTPSIISLGSLVDRTLTTPGGGSTPVGI